MRPKQSLALCYSHATFTTLGPEERGDDSVLVAVGHLPDASPRPVQQTNHGKFFLLLPLLGPDLQSQLVS